jgi:hypothetical protein
MAWSNSARLIFASRRISAWLCSAKKASRSRYSADNCPLEVASGLALEVPAGRPRSRPGRRCVGIEVAGWVLSASCGIVAPSLARRQPRGPSDRGLAGASAGWPQAARQCRQREANPIAISSRLTPRVISARNRGRRSARSRWSSSPAAAAPVGAQQRDPRRVGRSPPAAPWAAARAGPPRARSRRPSAAGRARTSRRASPGGDIIGKLIPA